MDDEQGLFIVCDGMGGHAAGEIASRTALDAALVYVQEHLPRLPPAEQTGDEQLREIVRGAIAAAALSVFERAHSDAEAAGMGCTMTLALMFGNKLAMAHVGDSRLYLVRGKGVSQLSTDHTVAAEMLRAGLLDEEDLPGHHYAHVLSRAIGSAPAVQAELLVLDLLPDDRLLLCSDGFSNYLHKPGSLTDALAGDALPEIAQKLIDSANEAGGADNITVIVVRCAADQPQPQRVEALEGRHDALRSVFLFEDLDLPLLTRVLACCRLESHEEGAVVVAEGAVIDELFIVLDGGYVLHRGEQRRAELRAGQHAGATTLLNPRAAASSLVAAEPSRMLRLRGRELSRLIRQRPWLGLGLLDRYVRRLSMDLDASIAQRAGLEPTRAGGERL